MKISPGLNVLRGLAALLIVIHHANSDVIPDLPDAKGAAGFLLWRIKNLGWSGIDLFFVLGGFFMGATVFADLRDRGRVRLGRYWKRRAERIIPSYYFLLVVLALTGATGYIDFSNAFSSIRGILTHFLFLNNYLDQLPNGPTWFLAAMVQFYILVPLSLSLLNRTRYMQVTDKFLTITIAVVFIDLTLRVLRMASGTHLPNDFMLTHFRLDTLFIGMLAMYLLRKRHPFVALLSSHPWISLLLALILIAPAMFFPRKDTFMFTVGFPLLACGYAGIILLIANGALKLTARGFVILAVISGWSYNIYLWHYFLPSLLGRPYVQLQFFIHSITTSANLMVFGQILVFVAFSILVGFLITVLVERPAVQFFSSRPNR